MQANANLMLFRLRTTGRIEDSRPVTEVARKPSVDLLPRRLQTVQPRPTAPAVKPVLR